MADNSWKQVNSGEIVGNPSFSQIIQRQKHSRSASEGELGIWRSPDGRNESTERSITVEFDGRYFNVPTLVKGQDDSAVQQILRGDYTDEIRDVAVKRARERVRAGFSLPVFRSEEEAVSAAKARSGTRLSQRPW